jgi:hypothetical protein
LADVVQQCGAHRGVVGAGPLRCICCLERVFLR